MISPTCHGPLDNSMHQTYLSDKVSGRSVCAPVHVCVLLGLISLGVADFCWIVPNASQFKLYNCDFLEVLDLLLIKGS